MVASRMVKEQDQLKYGKDKDVQGTKTLDSFSV